MEKTLRFFSGALIVCALAAVAPAIAQFLPGPDDSQDSGGNSSKGKKTAEAQSGNGPNIAGAWSGQVTQIGSEKPYKLELTVNARGAETRYPDLNCTGKLTRIGASKSYVFFVEVITKGQSEKGGRCPDGTLTLTRHGDSVALAWFGAPDNSPIVAYGTLTKK
ncbi:MAG TPA: hypothetical protein VIK79_11135 [Xanthobacteraceae bacterium]